MFDAVTMNMPEQHFCQGLWHCMLLSLSQEYMRACT